MNDTPRGLDRLVTGIPGLDFVLEGGLPKGGVYIVHGPPGAGKTILANQICFHQAKQGERAVYVMQLKAFPSAAALRTGKVVKWDAEGMTGTNVPGAQAFIEGSYRKGWELGV